MSCRWAPYPLPRRSNCSGTALAARPALALNGDAGAAVAQICDRLTGVPLAVELAAAMVRHMSLEVLRTRLEPRCAHDRALDLV